MVHTFFLEFNKNISRYNNEIFSILNEIANENFGLFWRHKNETIWKKSRNPIFFGNPQKHPLGKLNIFQNIQNIDFLKNSTTFYKLKLKLYQNF